MARLRLSMTDEFLRKGPLNQLNSWGWLTQDLREQRRGLGGLTPWPVMERLGVLHLQVPSSTPNLGLSNNNKKPRNL